MPDLPFTLLVHRELQYYLTRSRDDYWLKEGDAIIVYRISDNMAVYHTGDKYQDVGVFPIEFLDSTYTYDEWLEQRDEMPD